VIDHQRIRGKPPTGARGSGEEAVVVEVHVGTFTNKADSTPNDSDGSITITETWHYRAGMMPLADFAVQATG